MGVRTVTPFTVDALTTPEAITASGYCHTIRVKEQGGPTVIFDKRAPYATSPISRYDIGEEVVFQSKHGGFQPGQIVGFLETTSGSATFNQEEEF